MMLSLSRKTPSVALQRQALCSFSTLSSWCQQGTPLHPCSMKNTTAPTVKFALIRRLESPRTTTQMKIHRFDHRNTTFSGALLSPLSEMGSSSVRVFSTSGGSQQLPPWMHPESNKPGHYLEQYCMDLTALAESNKLDPVIGRHEEIRRCLQILARRTKSNPVCKC